METQTKAVLENLARRACEMNGVALYHLDCPSGRRGILRVFIEREGSAVSHSDCAQVSRYLGTLLDVEGAPSSSYTLEVSSPGLDRRLYERKHFERNLGSRIRIQTFAPVQGRRRMEGMLLAVTPREEAVLEVEGAHVEFPLSNVSRASVIFDARTADSFSRGERSAP